MTISKSASFDTVCDESFAGHRLDAFISEIADGVSRTYAQKLIDGRYVTVNGKPSRKNYKMQVLDSVTVSIPKPSVSDMSGQDIPLDVVYEDPDIIVINKPRGMVVHPACGNPDGTLVNALIHHCGGRLSDINGVIRPGIVHRLDKDTSGLIVAAKTNAAHSALAEAFRERRVYKLYNALAEGIVAPDSGLIDLPIGRHRTDRKRMDVPEYSGKKAVTGFRVRERLRGGTTLLDVEIETGRTHQIRVHLAHIGHPVVGDSIYGLLHGKNNEQSGGLLLHAARLEFTHPTSCERLSFKCALPDYFLAEIAAQRH